jgi:hypothetical protein
MSVNNVLASTTVATSKRANFRQLNQDVSSGTPSLGTNTYGYGRTYFVNLTSILNIKTHLMKSTIAFS